MGSYKKKLFIVLLLFLLISCYVCSSVNAASTDPFYQNFDNYNVEVVNLIKNEQEMLARAFLLRFDVVATESQKNSLKGYLNNYPSVYYAYFTYLINGNVVNLNLFFIPTNINWNNLDGLEIDTSKNLFYDDYISYPVSGYNISSSDINENIGKFRVTYSNNQAFLGNTTETIFLPTTLIYYKNETLYNYGQGVSPNMSFWEILKSSIDNNTDAVEDTTQAVNNLRNDFNEEESSSDYDFPTDNPTTDPTTSGIDNIFNMFYLRINSWNALGINVPIPFTGKSFSISPDITENIINGWTPTTNIATIFKTLLSGVWYYLLGRYIVKDVQHYVDGLQTGEILTKSDTNIKTEML